MPTINLSKKEVYNRIFEYDKLLSEIEKLKQALRKCNPITEVSEYNSLSIPKCAFCSSNGYGDIKHSEDCEYIKLIGGCEND